MIDTIDETDEVEALDVQMRLFYRSSNDDIWLLVKDSLGNVAIEHRPNESSGGEPSRIEVHAFLQMGLDRAEQQELLRLIGTLVDAAAAGSETS